MSSKSGKSRNKDAGEFKPRIALRFAARFQAATAKPEELACQWQALLARTGLDSQLGDARLEPLIQSVKPGHLAELIDRAAQVDPEYVPARFDLWVQIVCPPGLQPSDLAARLLALDEIDSAYVLRPGPPPVDPGDDPRFPNQGYLMAAPDGIDAEFAWDQLGGDGEGIGWVDMEQGWNLAHEDLVDAGITLISGVNHAWFAHGTSVVGQIAMVDNTIGGVGAAPSASGRVISQWRTTSTYNTADAILDAVANMTFGDVLLLEAQEYDPNPGGLYFWPVEIADGNYDAIRLATALGIVVVEAACNGGYDLDVYTSPSGARIFDRASADFRDSGAIMVGAASATVPHTRLGFSNHGNRVDCYAWGESIDTTSTNATGTNNTAYTTSFGGTSGASPIVVGAALIIQAISEKSLGYRFSPYELRVLLTIDGTPSNDPPVDRIGVMPDLRALITNSRINLAPDLYMRDKVGDTGDPTFGTVSQSPDIIVRQAPVADPESAFGVGSGTENDPGLSDPVESGIDHALYARVLNRGGSAATNVSVDLYWSPPSTLVSPTLWHPVGNTTLADVPAGNQLRVSDAVTWPAAEVPAPGHYCFIAIAGNAEDPAPGPVAFADFEQFRTFIRNNNNVAWRNFNVVAGPPAAGDPPGFYAEAFMIAGAFDMARRFEFETIARLPTGSRAFLEVPAWLADTLHAAPARLKLKKPSRNSVPIAINPHGLRGFGPVTLHKDARAACRLLVSIPKDHVRGNYEVAVRQLYQGEEVGRVTWRFEPAAKR